MPVTGKLIALEGPDHALLDRQAAQICRWLADLGIAIDRSAEPTGGPVGAQVRLHDQGRLHFTPQSLALLLVADRLDHLEKENGILSLLAAGRHVLCVGYTLSAYVRLSGQVPLDWHRRINARCRAPDLALYIGPDARELPETGDAIAWVDAAAGKEGIARHCRRHLSSLLSLGEA